MTYQQPHFLRASILNSMLLTQNWSDMFTRVKDLFHHAIRSQFLEVIMVTEVTVHNYFCLNFSMRAAHRIQR